MQYDRDQEYLRRYYQRQHDDKLEAAIERRRKKTIAAAHGSPDEGGRGRKQTLAVMMEKMESHPQERLKTILKQSQKLKNHGVVVTADSQGGMKIANKMRELDKIIREIELKQAKVKAEKKLEEDRMLANETFEERKSRRASIYQMKLISKHGSIADLEGRLRALEESEAEEEEEGLSAEMTPMTPHASGETPAELEEGEVNNRKRAAIERVKQRREEWRQARSARYIRTAKPREFEIELTLKEIFPEAEDQNFVAE